MERIKALLAVALFVAGLIFATPMTKNYPQIKSPQNRNTNKFETSVADTISNNHYNLQPVNDSEITAGNF